MGARHTEFALGFWLLISPVVFGHTGRAGLLLHDVAVGLAVMTLALLCYAPSLARAHLVQLVFATSLTASGWWMQQQQSSAAAQNHILVGLLLAMVALVPTRSASPPPGWRAGGAETGRVEGEAARPDVQSTAAGRRAPRESRAVSRS